MACAEGKTGVNICPRILPQLAEIDELTRAITRPPAGDLTHNPKPAAKTMGRAELARRKNEYFDEAFSMRGDPNPLHESMRSETIVLMEVKTNVIIGDEFIFITELSAKLAERYQRPLSSIAVHVQHSQCIFYAGTFEPAYVATVSALPAYVQPATNRRNACVLSEHLEEALGVPSLRGLVSFVTLPEENATCNGKTIAQALDDSPDGGKYGVGVIEEEISPGCGSRRKRLSVKSLSNIRAVPSAAPTGEMTPPSSVGNISVDDKPVKVARRRKSFMAGLFGRSNPKEKEKQAAGP